MAKAIPLTSEALRTPQVTPQAATPARSLQAAQAVEMAGALNPSPRFSNQPKPNQVPLQLRIPKDAAIAIKVAAAQRDMTISDFMLMCFQTHIQSTSAG